MKPDNFSTLIGLVSHYSPSGQELGAVNWLVEHMRSLNYDSAFIDDAGNAVGMMGAGPRQIILLGHIDTVPGEIPLSLNESHLHGRGVVDAKGALACFVDAAARFDSIEGWQLVVIGAVEEERDSDGARFVANHYKPDYAIVGEPNHWNRIALGYKGSANVNIHLKCEKTHSASTELSAAEQAVEMWIKIKAHVDALNSDKRKVFDKILLRLNDINSKSKPFEEWASLKINARLPLAVSLEHWFDMLQKIITDEEMGNISFESTGYAIPAWRCDKNTPLVKAFLKSIRSQGGEPCFAYKTGTADLNIVAPVWQCPMVVYGPGDSTLDHTPHENLAFEEYTRALKVLTSVISTLVMPKNIKIN
ncbi:MAG: [LysW]-lysine hydrolase [Anaerolineales bacterium]|nr:[LysW]-lysine hydrolase [Anaerolineales bacterium]